MRVPGDKRLTVLATGLAAAAVLLLAACAGKEAPEPNPLGPPVPETVQPEKIWNYLEGSDYRRFWPAQSVVKPGIHRGREPHGPLIDTFLNDTADNARPLGKEPLPPGSVVVLENHTTEPHVYSIDVMIKVKGHNPATNDWAFMRFSPGGEVLVSDREAQRKARKKNRGCIHCHSYTESTDFLFDPRFRD
ncbi:cytochrome P460 family protein [Thiohalorhabdus sp. Cl-TMA]|uniref:Cytochrome P460 family protein n=1 Tax=Thiohalorhabdus methylotrophus TaxID=3242694 RepID=A0ABV4TTP7_9GAMM